MITVYTRPGCPACVGTMRYLERHNLKYETVDIRESQTARDYITELGYTHLPVVVTGDGEHWSGLRIGMLKRLTNSIDNDVIEP